VIIRARNIRAIDKLSTSRGLERVGITTKLLLETRALLSLSKKTGI
jgi:hypothetical protein